MNARFIFVAFVLIGLAAGCAAPPQTGQYQFVTDGRNIYRGNTKTGEMLVFDQNGEWSKQVARPASISPFSGQFGSPSNDPNVGRPDAKTPHEGQGKIRFVVWVDGSDYLKIKDGKVWFEHRSYDLPGKWQTTNEATMVNSMEWWPAWNGNTSEPFAGNFPELPDGNNQTVKVKVHQGRGQVSVTEHPSDQNDHTLSILIDDDNELGPNWYDISVDW